MVWIYNSKVRKLYSQQHILDDQLAFYSILSKLKKKEKRKKKKEKKEVFYSHVNLSIFMLTSNITFSFTNNNSPHWQFVKFFVSLTLLTFFFF